MSDWLSSELMAGFECATYRRRDGVRLDLIASTRHDARAIEDYRLVADHGMTRIRDGIRWHRVQPQRGVWDWSSFDTMVEAADRAGVGVAWDLLHFGFPDWIEPLSPGFVEHFADFAVRAALRAGSDAAFVPVNEISFLAWACGEDGFMHPHHRFRGEAVKRALCAAFIAAAQAIRLLDPRLPILCAEPLIAVHAESDDHDEVAQWEHAAQYEAVDTLLGLRSPELGGHAGLIDAIGVNHYPHSQWVEPSRRAPVRPALLADLLVEAGQRYHKPMFIAETGCEGDFRADWFAYVAGEVAAARRTGADVRSICLYPVLNHLGWEDGRYCPNGLFCGVAEERIIHRPLGDAIMRWQAGDEERRPFPPAHLPAPVAIAPMEALIA